MWLWRSRSDGDACFVRGSWKSPEHNSVDFIIKVKPWVWMSCCVVTYLVDRKTLTRLGVHCEGLGLHNRQSTPLCAAVCRSVYDILARVVDPTIGGSLLSKGAKANSCAVVVRAEREMESRSWEVSKSSRARAVNAKRHCRGL